MTLLFFDGFQDPLVMPKPEWSGVMWGSAQPGRDGQSNGAAASQTGNRILTLPVAAATCIAGTAHRPSITGNTDTVLSFCTAGAAQQLTIRWSTTGMLEARKGGTAGTLLGTSTGHTAQAPNTWGHVSAKVVLHLTAGSVEVRLNGITVLTVTGVSTSTVTGSVTNILCGGTNQNFSFWDDMWVCDDVDATATQGRPNNDFLGDLRVAVLLPTSAGDTTGWTPSAGTNFGAVDEVPPNTTDYVGATTPGARDLYNVTDLPASVTAIYGVRAGYYATKSDAGAILMKPVIKENSVVTVESAVSVPFGSWVPAYGPAYYRRPSDSALWTLAGVNALQAGQEIA